MRSFLQPLPRRSVFGAAFLFLFTFSAIAQLPVGRWSGAAGVPGATMVPDPLKVPVEFFEEGLAGRLQLSISAPSAKAPQGAYTAQFALRHGNQTLAFRHKGTLGENGSISATWSASGVPAQVTLTRSPMAPDAAFLYGTATIGATSYPIFLLPETFGAKAPLPAGVDGAFTLFLHDPALSSGTGFGTASISKAGAVKISAALSDGTKTTQSSAILLGGTTPFLVAAAPVGRTGYLGAWALRDITLEDCDWNGYALQSAAPRRLLLASYPKPAPSLPSFPSSSAMLDLQLSPDFPVANGQLAFDGKSRFLPVFLNGANAWGVSLLSLTLNPSTGAATGRIEYFYTPSPNSDALRETASLSGMLNRKTGEIHGLIQARRALGLSGPFQVTPLP